MAQASWTDEDIATLRRMARVGADDRQISQAVGRSVNAVNKARRRYNLPAFRDLTRWTDAEVFALSRAYHAGLSDKAIAVKIGRTVGTVRAKRRHLGLERSTKGKKIPVYRSPEDELIRRNRAFLRALTRAHPERAKAILRGENTDYFGQSGVVHAA